MDTNPPAKARIDAKCEQLSSDRAAARSKSAVDCTLSAAKVAASPPTMLFRTAHPPGYRTRASSRSSASSCLLIVSMSAHEQRDEQSVVIAPPAGRRSRRTAACYLRGRSCQVGEPRHPSSQRPCRLCHQQTLALLPLGRLWCLGPTRVLETQQCYISETSAAGRGAAPQHAREVSRKDHSSILRYSILPHVSFLFGMTVG